MSEYKKVKIGDFLEQYRNTIWIDDSVEYGQITISSKDGVKFRCLKIGKEIGRKRQFVIDLKSHPNTVIFTRQGIADGSIGIAPSNVNGCIATENMPMFSVNENIILVEYLENLLISPVFKELVAKITPSGSAQKSIHERDLLQLEITLPDLETQKKIVKKVSINLKNVETLTKEIESQKAYAKQLRQNILQDAIEGKLTAEWRKTHPVIKGNPDFDAEALFEEIAAGKASSPSFAKSKTSKQLPPISDDEKPFEIPDGWKWVRLGEIINDFPRNGYSPKAVDFETDTKTLKLGAVTYGIFNPNEYKYIDETIPADSNYWLKSGDILIERSNSFEYVGICAIYTGKDNEFIYPDLLMKFRVNELISNELIHKILIAPYNRQYFMSKAKGAQKTMPKINQETVVNTLIPLSPIEEQKKIIFILNQKLNSVELIEQQISQREEYANQLMQSILKDVFEENHD